MKKALIIISVILFSGSVFSQTILLDEKPDSLYGVKKWGQNRRNFIHFYLDYGFAVGKPEGGIFELKYGFSREWKLGLRYKRRFCKHYAMGLDLSVAEDRYRFAQTGTKVFPDQVLHDQEYLALPNIGLEYFNRINFGKRGNKVGKYVDFGIYGTSTFAAYRRYWDELPTSVNGAKKVKIKEYSLDYLTDLQWGFKSRLGYNGFSIWASYRMSDWFNSQVHNASLSGELPRTTVGMEIGLF